MVEDGMTDLAKSPPHVSSSDDELTALSDQVDWASLTSELQYRVTSITAFR